MKKRELTTTEKVIVGIVGVTAAVCMAALQFVGGSAEIPQSEPVQPQTAQTQEQKSTTNLIDNDLVTVDYEGMYEAPGVQDTFYVGLNVQNKRSKDIWVYLDKASVNSETVSMVMTGMPLYIEPGNSGRTGFIFPMGQLSVHSLRGVEKVKFDLVVADKATLTEIWRGKDIEISQGS